jgi:translation initiation factor 4E
MKPLNQLPKGSSYFLFKNDIKPSWEDTKNIGGGRFIIAIKKDDSGNKIWEDLLLELMTNTPETQLINGVLANTRTNESLLSIWTSKIGNQEMFNIRHWLKKILGLPAEISIKYKEHPNNEEIKKKQKELQKIEEKRRMQKEKDFLLS